MQTKTDEILFRCSRIGSLMTNAQSKEPGALSKTAKSYIEEVWRKNKFGYEEKVMTDPMKKGLICEQDSMSLVQSVIGGSLRLRYNKELSNEYIKGTPDIVLFNDGIIEDIKTSYTLKTFMDAELDSNYYGQGQGYMQLANELPNLKVPFTQYRLIYCLVPTPDDMIQNERMRLGYKFLDNENNPDYKDMDEQIQHNNNIISKIPEIERVKVFPFEFDGGYISELYHRIRAAREYYKGIVLNPHKYLPN